MNLYAAETSETGSASCDGLDAMRVVSSFGVVFLHVCGATGVPGSLEWVVKFRDFALPVMILSSFFVLTVSLRRKPEAARERSVFLNRRVVRLFLPCFVWTLFYVIFSAFLVPLAAGAELSLGGFSAVVFLTGYRHLWYLQFLFAGSILAYPLILKLSAERRRSEAKLLLFCAGGAFLYLSLYHFVLRQQIWHLLGDERDVNLQIFAEQTVRYLWLIPLGIGLGFAGETVTKLFKNPFCRRVSLLGGVLAMLLHVGKFPFPASQEIYGLMIFLAALQPWKKVRFRFWRKLVEQSYGVYIVHFFWVHLLWLYVAHDNPEIGAFWVLGATIVVYFLSFAASALIRKVFPCEWLLPLVGKRTGAPAQALQLRRLSPAREK